MFLTGGDTHVFPVNSWDGYDIGDGRPGPVSRRLLELLEAEAETGSGEPPDYVEVPYP